MTWNLATDPAHVEPVSRIIYYDLLQSPGVYLDRAGQIARAEEKGWVWSLISPDQSSWLDRVHALTGLAIAKMEYAPFQSGSASPQGSSRPASQSGQGAYQSLVHRANRLEPINQLPPQELARRFPGGVLPRTTPPPTLSRRFRSRRR